MRKTNLLLLPLAVASLIWVGCSSGDSNTTDVETAVTLADQPAASDASTATSALPAVAAHSAQDVDGATRQLSEWIGQQPVVINFWGTWCPPCRREIPGLVKLYGEYRGRGVEIVSFAMERTAGPQQVKAFADKAGMEWVQMMANENVARGFRLTGSVPTTIFLDRYGKEVARHVGARSYEDFKRDFEKIASGG